MSEQTETPLSFESPESSTIERASYDPDTQTLTVEFKRAPKDKTDTIYTYSGVSAETWEAFEQAPSKGTHFVKRIRPLHAGRAKR